MSRHCAVYFIVVVKRYGTIKKIYKGTPESAHLGDLSMTTFPDTMDDGTMQTNIIHLKRCTVKCLIDISRQFSMALGMDTPYPAWYGVTSVISNLACAFCYV